MPIGVDINFWLENEREAQERFNCLQRVENEPS